MGRARQTAFEEIRTPFLLWCFTHNQDLSCYLTYSISSEPHIHLQKLILDIHCFGNWLREGEISTGLHSSCKSSSSKSRLFAQSWAYALLFGEARTVCVRAGGGTGVTPVTMLWAGVGSTEVGRWGRCRQVDSVARYTDTAEGSGVGWQRLDPNPFQ